MSSRTVRFNEPDFGREVELELTHENGYTYVNWYKIDPTLHEFLAIQQKEQGFDLYPFNNFLGKYWAREIDEALKEE